MKRLMLVVFVLCGIGVINAQLPVKLDLNLNNNPAQVEPGWQQFLAADSGLTTYDGATVTIGGPVAGWRYRTTVCLNQELWRDFVYSAGSLTITIDGLLADTYYGISIGAFDSESKNGTPHAADWKVDGETILKTSFGIPGVTMASLYPSEEHNYLFSGYAKSDPNGTIFLESSASADNGGSSYAFVNAIVIDVPKGAHDPQPSNNSTGVFLDEALSWTTGNDPNNIGQPNSNIKTHYLYYTSEPNFVNVDPIEISAGSPVSLTASYSPEDLEMDRTYIWRVDEAIDDGQGGFSGPDDPETIVGKVWTFETVKSNATISTQPSNLKSFPGETAEFSVEFSSYSPAFAAWFKDGVPVSTGGDITVTTTMTGSTLSIANADVLDEGSYSCTVTNDAGDTPSESAMFAIKRPLAHYPFEQSGEDAAGDNDGTAVGGMDYADGFVTTESQAWAADPNGTNYFEVSKDTAYPRAGWGKGLEEFTYSFWVKRGTYPGNGRILGTFNDDSNSAVQVNVTGAGSIGCYIRQEGNQFRELNTADGTIAADEWNFVTFTFKDGIMSCFVNGNYLERRNYSSFEPMVNFAEWQYPMAILARNVRGVVGEFYPGLADDLRIYNYVLSNEDIARLYYNETGIFQCIYDVSKYDLTGDCVVNFEDFAEFAANWLVSGLFDPEN